jgi:hypothetical protein
MRRTNGNLRHTFGLLLGSSLVALAASGLLAVSAGAEGASAVACPLTAADVSGIVGRNVQRVNLGDDDGDPSEQCAFSSISRSTGMKRSPQVFLTVDPGGVADLRDLYTYYVSARSRLATKPRVALRPDLGPGGFTLTATTAPVTTAFLVLGKAGIGTLTVDLGGAPLALRDPDTADELFALVHSRSH